MQTDCYLRFQSFADFVPLAYVAGSRQADACPHHGAAFYQLFILEPLQCLSDR
jgi:hypothetical protein